MLHRDSPLPNVQGEARELLCDEASLSTAMLGGSVGMATELWQKQHKQANEAAAGED